MITPTKLRTGDEVIVVNLSGRGDKDMDAYTRFMEESQGKS